MSFITEIKTFAALGSGVIGSGWVSRALAHGLDVVAWDPAPGAEPDVTIRTEGDKTITEYRINGFLYAIKITPSVGKPYFLVRADASQMWTRSDKPEMLMAAIAVPFWSKIGAPTQRPSSSLSRSSRA